MDSRHAQTHCMKTQKVYLPLPIPNLRGYHPIVCSGKPNPSKRQSHLGAWPWELGVVGSKDLSHNNKFCRFIPMYILIVLDRHRSVESNSVTHIKGGRCVQHQCYQHTWISIWESVFCQLPIEHRANWRQQLRERRDHRPTECRMRNQIEYLHCWGGLERDKNSMKSYFIPINIAHTCTHAALANV